MKWGGGGKKEKALAKPHAPEMGHSEGRKKLFPTKTGESTRKSLRGRVRTQARTHSVPGRFGAGTENGREGFFFESARGGNGGDFREGNQTEKSVPTPAEWGWVGRGSEGRVIDQTGHKGGGEEDQLSRKI